MLEAEMRWDVAVPLDDLVVKIVHLIVVDRRAALGR